jgi:hypothetical protein
VACNYMLKCDPFQNDPEIKNPCVLLLYLKEPFWRPNKTKYKRLGKGRTEL